MEGGAVIDYVQECVCSHERRHHDRDSCARTDGCSCEQTYMDVGREHRDRREGRTSRASLGPEGLCGDRTEHAPHLHESASLGRFWCTADETDREPGRSQRRVDAGR